MALLEDRLSAAKETLKSKSSDLFALQEALTTAKQHRARYV